MFRFSPSHVKFYMDEACQKKMDFQSILPDDKETVSMKCYLKSRGGARKIRVILSPIPDEKAEESVKRAHRRASKKQNNLSERTKIYARWLFIATSLEDNIRAEDIVASYSKRWQIELHFKRSKSLLNFHSLRRCSKLYAFSIVSIWVALTALIYLLFKSTLSARDNPISLFNAFSLLVDCIS